MARMELDGRSVVCGRANCHVNLGVSNIPLQAEKNLLVYIQLSQSIVQIVIAYMLTGILTQSCKVKIGVCDKAMRVLQQDGD